MHAFLSGTIHRRLSTFLPLPIDTSPLIHLLSPLPFSRYLSLFQVSHRYVLFVFMCIFVLFTGITLGYFTHPYTPIGHYHSYSLGHCRSLVLSLVMSLVPLILASHLRVIRRHYFCHYSLFRVMPVAHAHAPAARRQFRYALVVQCDSVGIAVSWQTEARTCWHNNDIMMMINFIRLLYLRCILWRYTRSEMLMICRNISFNCTQ